MIGTQGIAAQVQSGHNFSEFVSILHFVHSSIVIMVVIFSLFLHYLTVFIPTHEFCLLFSHLSSPSQQG